MFFTILKALAFAGAAIVGGIMAYRAYEDRGSHNFVNNTNMNNRLGYAGYSQTPTYGYQNPYQTTYQQPQYAYAAPAQETIPMQTGGFIDKSVIDELARLVVERIVELRRQQQFMAPPVPELPMEPEFVEVPETQIRPITVEPAPVEIAAASMQSDWDREGDRALMLVQEKESQRGVRVPCEIIGPTSRTVINAVNTVPTFNIDRRHDQYYDSEIHDMLSRDRMIRPIEPAYPLCDYHDAFGGYIPVDRLETYPRERMIVDMSPLENPMQIEPMYIESQPAPCTKLFGQKFHYQTNWG